MAFECFAPSPVGNANDQQLLDLTVAFTKTVNPDYQPLQVSVPYQNHFTVFNVDYALNTMVNYDRFQTYETILVSLRTPNQAGGFAPGFIMPKTGFGTIRSCIRELVLKNPTPGAIITLTPINNTTPFIVVPFRIEGTLFWKLDANKMFSNIYHAIREKTPAAKEMAEKLHLHTGLPLTVGSQVYYMQDIRLQQTYADIVLQYIVKVSEITPVLCANNTDYMFVLDPRVLE